MGTTENACFPRLLRTSYYLACLIMCVCIVSVTVCGSSSSSNQGQEYHRELTSIVLVLKTYFETICEERLNSLHIHG